MASVFDFRMLSRPANNPDAKLSDLDTQFKFASNLVESRSNEIQTQNSELQGKTSFEKQRKSFEGVFKRKPINKFSFKNMILKTPIHYTSSMAKNFIKENFGYLDEKLFMDENLDSFEVCDKIYTHANHMKEREIKIINELYLKPKSQATNRHRSYDNSK